MLLSKRTTRQSLRIRLIATALLITVLSACSAQGQREFVRNWADNSKRLTQNQQMVQSIEGQSPQTDFKQRHKTFEKNATNGFFSALLQSLLALFNSD